MYIKYIHIKIYIYKKYIYIFIIAVITLHIVGSLLICTFLYFELP